MNKFEKIVGDLYLLKVPFSNVWTGVILSTGETDGSGRKVLIDSSNQRERVDDTIVPALAEMGLKLTDVSVLLCTHTHGDHVGGHARIRELAPDVKIYCYDKSLPKMRDPLKYNKAIRAVFPEYSPAPSAGLTGIEPDEVIGDYALVCDRFRLIPAAGHDTDTVCWLDTATGTLVCGDSLQANGTDSQGMALYMDLPSYRATLHRLLDLGADNLITGHDYNPVGISAFGRENVKKYLETCLELVSFYDGFIRAMYACGKSEPEIAEALIDEVHGVRPSYLFLALHTVDSHIREIKKERA